MIFNSSFYFLSGTGVGSTGFFFIFEINMKEGEEKPPFFYIYMYRTYKRNAERFDTMFLRMICTLSY